MGPDLKVLIIDDDEDDYFITSQYLQEIQSIPVICSWCYNINDAQEKLIANNYDLYFLDYRLGARTGLELLQEAIAAGTYKPIILLTGKGTVEIDKKAIELGAYDYLIKSELTSEKLERCIRYAFERYKSFKVINDKERKYRMIFENALSFIFTCDELLHFSECNPACSYLLGLSPSELQGTSILSYVWREDQDELINLLQRRKNIRNMNLRFVTSHDEVKTCNLTLTYFERNDIAPHWQGILFDETMRMQAEQTKLQLEKLEATYRLVRTLAHEIRNPLTNIGLALEGLEEPGLSSDQTPYTDIIQRSAGRINGIINELLKSSKAIELRPESVDLNELIRDVMTIAQDRIDLKHIHTEILYSEIPVVRELDREKFKIAILNLVVNAVEAMEGQGGHLTVSLSQQNDQTSITVKDNGSGIKDDELKKLFEPYFTTKKTGMGLGLVSTLNILKSHKAGIEVESRPAFGTVFKIVFSN